MLQMIQSFLITVFFVFSNLAPAWAEGDPEKDRLSGFAEHQRKLKKFDEAREKGERDYLEKEAQWAEKQSKELLEYKKSKRNAEVKDTGPEAQDDAVSKKRFLEEYEADRLAFSKERSRRKALSREQNILPSEAKELGLAEGRPRYDYRKRIQYGGTSKWGKKGSGSAGDSYSPSFGGGTLPPPPTFDDFGGDTGYVPAPNMSDDFGDIVPPPPPPMPIGTDFGTGSFGESPPDFAPPPPPPFINEGNSF